MLLTVGIPTYNRGESITRLLHQFLGTPAAQMIDVVVIDDGGEDDTYAKLSADPMIASQVRLLKNESNLGYPRTFLRLFTECKTEYLMIMADDDQIVTEQLGSIMAYLESERPAFASPQFLRGTSVYRGRSTSGPIAAGDFFKASAHAPGLIYRVDVCRPALAELSQRVESKMSDALVYPQVVILIRLLVDAAKCVWLAAPSAAEGEYEPSGIRDAGGGTYWSVESRWRQLTAFNSLLIQHVTTDTTGVAKRMLDTHHKQVFRMMSRAMHDEDSSLGAAFDAGAKDLYAGARLKRVRKRLYRWVKGFLPRTSSAR